MYPNILVNTLSVTKSHLVIIIAIMFVSHCLLIIGTITCAGKSHQPERRSAPATMCQLLFH